MGRSSCYPQFTGRGWGNLTPKPGPSGRHSRGLPRSSTAGACSALAQTWPLGRLRVLRIQGGGRTPPASSAGGLSRLSRATGTQAGVPRPCHRRDDRTPTRFPPFSPSRPLCPLLNDSPPPYPCGGTSQDPQWMPEAGGSPGPGPGAAVAEPPAPLLLLCGAVTE